MVVANRVNASFVNLQLGDAATAKVLATSALAAAREIGFPVFEAAALANLGNAERALGELDAAIAHMEAGIALRRPLQEPRDFVDDLADLTIAYAAAGDRDSAASTAHELLVLAEPAFEGAFWPHYAWWAISLGFAASGAADRAEEAATRAASELRTFADLIEDETTRAAFLAVPVNARIGAEAAERTARPAHGALLRSGGEKRR
jgi:tetratricopeptide (TPR) repeat protein